GHTGPVVTDALDMAALHHIEGAGPGTTPAHSVARAAVLALAGGADLLCLGSTEGRDDAEMFHTVRTAIEQAVAGGELDRAGLAISARRNPALVQPVRARQHTVPAPELSVALAELAKDGPRDAPAAVRTDVGVRAHRHHGCRTGHPGRAGTAGAARCADLGPHQPGPPRGCTDRARGR